MITHKLLQTRREPQWGTGKHSGGPQTFLQGHFEEKIFDFFLKWCILAYLIFLSDGGAPQTSRARGSLPPSTPPSWRAWAAALSLAKFGVNMYLDNLWSDTDISRSWVKGQGQVGLYAGLPNMFLTDLLEHFMKCYIYKMPPNVILLTKSPWTNYSG